MKVIHRDSQYSDEELESRFPKTELQRLLTDVGWSQSSFARRIGVSQQSVNMWCKGRKTTNSIALAYARLVNSILNGGKLPPMEVEDGE